MSRTPAQRANLNPPQKPGQPPLNSLGRVFGSRPAEAALHDLERLLVRGYAPDGTSVLPEVCKTLNWVRLANRLPVRIFREERDGERLLRMGTTAVAPIRGFSAQAAPAAPAR